MIVSFESIVQMNNVILIQPVDARIFVHGLRNSRHERVTVQLGVDVFESSHLIGQSEVFAIVHIPRNASAVIYEVV